MPTVDDRETKTKLMVRKRTMKFSIKTAAGVMSRSPPPPPPPPTAKFNFALCNSCLACFFLFLYNLNQWIWTTHTKRWSVWVGPKYASWGKGHCCLPRFHSVPSKPSAHPTHTQHASTIVSKLINVKVRYWSIVKATTYSLLPCGRYLSISFLASPPLFRVKKALTL